MRRWLIQTIAFFAGNNYFQAIINNTGFYQGPLKRFCLPYFTCYSCPLAIASCPLGSIQHFFTLQTIPFYVFGFLALIGTGVGRLICGYTCPIGFGQDLLYRVKTIKFKIPRWTRYVKYAVLASLIIIIPYFTFEPWFCKLCPVGMFQAGIPLVMWDPPAFDLRPLAGAFYYLKIGIVTATIIFIITVRRGFCRVFCPLGAIYSFFNKISIFRIVRTEDCRYCELCIEVCPVEINVFENPNQMECIRCLECVRVCKNGGLKFGMKL